MARLAAALYLVSGLVTLVSPLLPSPPGVNRLGVMAVGVVAILLSPIVWIVPWDRLPRGASLWTAGLVAQALIGLHNYFGGADPYRYGLFFMVSYLWVGLAQPRWSTFKLAPFSALAYLGPLVASGHPAWARWSILYALPVFLLAGEATAWVSERLREAQQSLSVQAYQDGLTRLPNRVLFQLEVEESLSRANFEAGGLGVLFVDLDRFKLINDTLGHDAGDELLCQVADRLRSAVRAGDVVARIGGDEFTVLAHAVAGAEEAEAVARRLLACFDQPFVVHGAPVKAGASVGIAFADHAGADIETLLRNSDLAMYMAKDGGGQTFRFFDSAMGTESQDRMMLEAELRTAIDDEQLRVMFQPIVDLASGAVVGCEALVRWQHPVRGLLSPAEFLSVAEESGLIVALGAWVTDAAIAQGARWWGTLGEASPEISVNISARELERPGYAASLARALAARGLPPAKLVLEITEGTMLRPCVSDAVLRDLRGLGVNVAIDDFGTGYSSLAYLKELPARGVKLDRRFIAGLGADPADDAIVRSVIELGKSLGLTVTAEGVERPAQVERLLALGCPTAQGFLFSHPVPAEAISALLAAPGPAVAQSA